MCAKRSPKQRSNTNNRILNKSSQHLHNNGAISFKVRETPDVLPSYTKKIPKTKKQQKQKNLESKFTMLRSCARSYFIPGQGDRRLFIIRGESSNLACQCPSESRDGCQSKKFDKRLKKFWWRVTVVTDWLKP